MVQDKEHAASVSPRKKQNKQPWGSIKFHALNSYFFPSITFFIFYFCMDVRGPASMWVPNP
jgi:hypothetical protein